MLKIICTAQDKMNILLHEFESSYDNSQLGRNINQASNVCIVRLICYWFIKFRDRDERRRDKKDRKLPTAVTNKLMKDDKTVFKK